MSLIKEGGLFCFLAFSHITNLRNETCPKCKQTYVYTNEKAKPQVFWKGFKPSFFQGQRRLQHWGQTFHERSTAEPLITSSEAWGNSLCLRHAFILLFSSALAILLQPLNKDGSLFHHNNVFWI